MKKALSLLLTLALCLSCLVLPVSAARDISYEEGLAGELKSLGLFRGVSDTDFDLARPMTRVEALVMLIRILGKEQEAVSSSWRHPFTDTPAWADTYIGYAYHEGITNGISSTEFGTGSASAAMYLTFVLRALGYSDAEGGDFRWDAPFALASQVGITPVGVDLTNFWRADAVIVSHSALMAYQKDSRITLSEKLISLGVFSSELFAAVYNKGAGTAKARDPLTAEQIYARCSPAVFCLTTYDYAGQPCSLGSGFFISSDGVALTNCHVLAGAASATALMTDGTVRAITGVISWNAEIDYAIIQVEGSGYPAIPLGDSDLVTGGQTIYTLGNPQGLTNTIASGLVSNPYRADYNGMIQISAPISPGSSGGVLLNVYGEAIGITTATLQSGQNLNFAVPILAAVAKGIAPSTLQQLYGLTSMGRFAAMNNTVQAGRDAAFTSLCRFIDDNYNQVYGTDKSFDYLDEEDLILYSISYSAEQDQLILFCDQFYDYGEDCATFIHIDRKSNSFYCSYAYYIDSEQTTYGWSMMDPAEFYLSMRFSFSDYNGNISYLQEDEETAKEMFLYSLFYLDIVFDSLIGHYDVSDLGFINLSKINF